MADEDASRFRAIGRKSIRVSMGHVLRIPFARCASLAESIIALKAARRGADGDVRLPRAGYRPHAALVGAASRVAGER